MIIGLDLETTGLDAIEDRIMEVALVKFDEKTFEVIDTYSTLINPETEIPELISNITNIWDSDVKGAPKWNEVKEEIAQFIGDSPILGHNTKFDSSFLRANSVELKSNIELDTFDLANFLLLDEKSLSLEALCSSLGLKLEGAHRALNDTLATIKLFELLIVKLRKMSTLKLKILDYISNKSEDKSFSFVYNTLLRKASKIKDDETFLKEFVKLFPKNTQQVNREHNSEINISDLEDFTNSQKDLELRDNQSKMSGIISKAFSNEQKVVIEAPTGVGKTFAYLLPSVLHSVKMGEQVFISTSTKALQDQVFYKDLDFLSKKLGVEFSYTKLKGKSNYIGILAFVNFFTGLKKLTKQETSFCLKILFWLLKTKTGELDELDYFGREFSFLREINADDFLTFSNENNFEKYEYAVIARRRARKANIVVINNNILFQDIDGENSILGKVENLVLDEAHTLEDVVTNSFKKSFSLLDFEKHLVNVEKTLKKNNFTLDGFGKKVDSLIFEMGIVFDTFQLYLNRKVKSDDKYKNILIKEDFYNIELDNIDKKELSNIIQLKVTEILDSFSVLPDALYLSLGREIRFLEGVLDIVKILLDKKDNTHIKLLNYNEKKGGIYLEYTLLNVGGYLQTKLWSKLNSCVITSATLQVGENFDYIRKMLNLEDFSFYTLESDFDYSKQALLFIPNDLGSIKNNLSEVISFLKDFLLVVKGNTLVLFTAFYAIKEAYTRLGGECREKGISLFAQSIGGGKHKLIESFKKHSDTSVLIGTDTFWEGIDIPGKDLKYLIIHKVPFMVPSDPIFQARSKLFQNAFMDYGVPKSILKLKQGFGRLIRTKTDNGIVVFLDNRIYSTSWGDIFYSSFPSNIKVRHGKSGDLIKILSNKKKD